MWSPPFCLQLNTVEEETLPRRHCAAFKAQTVQLSRAEKLLQILKLHGLKFIIQTVITDCEQVQAPCSERSKLLSVLQDVFSLLCREDLRIVVFYLHLSFESLSACKQVSARSAGWLM